MSNPAPRRWWQWSPVLLLVLAACGGGDGAPTAPAGSVPTVTADGARGVAGGVLNSVTTTAVLPAECATTDRAQSAIDSLLPQVFKPGAGKRGRAQGFSNTIEKARRDGDVPLAQLTVEQFINFTLQGYFSGDLLGGQSTDTQARVLKLIYLLYCSNNISPVPDLSGIFASANTVLIRPTTPDTVVRDDRVNTQAALLVRTGDVPDALFGTFVSVVPSATPLPTPLDWYGLTGLRSGSFEFIANPAVTFDAPVRAGVCVDYDETVVTDPLDLRLAHGIDPANPPPPTPGNVIFGSIEILAPQPVGALGLDCAALPVPLSAAGRLLNGFASWVLPRPLFASSALLGGTRGGDIRSLSPFGVVDTRLALSASTTATSPVFIPLGSTTASAPVNAAVRTRNAGTPIAGIGLAFGPDGLAPATAVTGTTGAATATWTFGAGTATATVTATQAPFTFVPNPATVSLTAVQVQPVVIGAGTPPAGTQTLPYGPFTFTATGGIGSAYSWSVTSGALPAGLVLSPAGVLSGTPTAAGSFTATIRVTSGPATLNAFAETSVTIVIATPPTDIVTTTLPVAQRGLAYSTTLAATGGNGTYVWGLDSGTLPDGLALSTTGVISGTPTATSATSSFTVRATSDGRSDTQALTLTVGSPTALALSYAVGPSSARCYALNVILSPNIAVQVRDQAGRALAGVRVDIVAETNNGSKVAVSQPFAITGANGQAVFNTLSINKTGGYRLIATTGTPWPAATVQSGRFNISPSC